MYIKQIELSRFKSFGGTTAVPLLPGFTVISGPNGSGKSNILDALLFALGLSSSKGMRADRLPDLVNQSHAQKGRTVEMMVKVVFALDQGKEWQVSRKLRVTGQGTYTSTYYVDQNPCTLTELHEQLAQLRIYPEGYNVVLQGDVTSIISMNARDRREIIDELAGVGEFDRKITQAKEKLEEVRLQEERFRIVEGELIQTQERLQADRVKAEKYQQVRQELEDLITAEMVVQYRSYEAQIEASSQQLELGRQQNLELAEQIALLTAAIANSMTELESLNHQIQLLGEQEYLQLSSEIAQQQAELRSQARQSQELSQAAQQYQTEINQLQQEISDYQRQSQAIDQNLQNLDLELINQQQACHCQSQVVQSSQQQVSAIAAASQSWIEQQSHLYQELAKLQANLAGLQQEQARLGEALSTRTELEYGAELEQIQANLPHLRQQLELVMVTASELEAQMQAIATGFSAAQTELQVCQQTRDRLIQEQRQKNRQLDKLEAEAQVNQAVQSNRLIEVILHHDLQGVYGLVAQLGRVEPRYQLALEIAAGGRLTNVVVEDDQVASAAIEILKQERAGRATFLPLNRLANSGYLPRLQASWGAIDYAFNLVSFEPKFFQVFAHVFGQTLVFESLTQARSHLGKQRMVTLEGELLETSGAITGGSSNQRQSLHFGTAREQNRELPELQARLGELERMLQKLEYRQREAQEQLNRSQQELQQARTKQAEVQLRRDRLSQQIEQLEQRATHLQAKTTVLEAEVHLINSQLHHTNAEISTLTPQVAAAQARLTAWEQATNHQEWQQAQGQLQIQEQLLQKLELQARSLEQQITDRQAQAQVLQEKIHQRQTRLAQIRQQQTDNFNLQTAIAKTMQLLEQQLHQSQARLSALEQTLLSTKQQRDQADRQHRQQQQQLQQAQWQQEKTQERQEQIKLELAQVKAQLSQLELPDPLPDLPRNISLEQLQHDQRRLQKRLQAMEPVNMKAIAEFEATTTRLTDLSQRLETLSQERTEILLRIEDFTTLRQRAFMQAFTAIDQNFQEIFAELSDGDGHLQLEYPSAPLSGGLNLVAHPKGKPVQHLSSMSGGEKSLTALSFIFALQRYRPSPFYAFDEVDMFLDGANVERLSRMVRKQAQQAQFIVVSLRRPMIEAAERTIGVTQARGAHTQVLGLALI
ncbi:MAG: chromosome segregation protein SMC [Pseudanabaenaceae cyanobacterium bins.68]|nr:chromosome segregation protein SMC [Pseudanabaenaceae cyanobacterium bins.68]